MPGVEPSDRSVIGPVAGISHFASRRLRLEACGIHVPQPLRRQRHDERFIDSAPPRSAAARRVPEKRYWRRSVGGSQPIVALVDQLAQRDGGGGTGGRRR